MAPTLVAEPAGEARRRGRPVEAGDALVVATSGTTGEPKAAVLTHTAVAASAAATSARLGIDPARHRWLACLPVAHIGGLAVVARALVTGTPLEVHPGFEARAVEAAARAGCTHVSLVVTALARLDPSVFERIVLGGSAMPAVRPANVTATYGLTETGSGCVYDGFALDGVEVRVVGGEVQLRGPMLLRGYRDGRDPKDAEGWFGTGDEGSLGPGGRLSVLGRRGDVIVTGGQKVWPDPVERVLGGLDGVAEVAVVGRPDAEWGEVVTAVVVPADPAAPPHLGRLREAVKAELAPYCAPQRLELAASLPRTTLGKLQRAVLRGVPAGQAPPTTTAR
ncbi:MAG: AMP-binding protein [Acidimicrobiia bacterium]|nr:AMP-binding protein [Acidimicrobiia bacterium]